MTKNLKKIIAVLLLVVMNTAMLMNCVQAANLTSKTIYQIDYCEKILKYKGTPRGAAYVVYEKDGKQYPAYCINPERIGVGETDSYDVTVGTNITDVILWRIITNGYPYKTLEELGVANEKEAYLATKQAVYCYLDNRNVYEYSGIGESGTRTLNALRQIWNNAMSSTETKISNTVEVKQVTNIWEKDKIDEKYISKTYEIQYPAPITNYTVEIKGENIPKGLIITDANNDIKDSFKAKERFKILIPASSLNQSGSFEINIKTQMETKPVLYGGGPSEDLQNYALTMYEYEDSTGSYKEEYQKNTAQIKILKQEKETKKPLQGVEFQLLDKNKNEIYQSLITDKNGRVTLENIEPGTYYIRETKTLQGYVRYSEDIKIDISLNEIINVTVNNSKEKKIEVSKEETQIEVGQEGTKENINEKNETNTHEKVENEKQENITEIEKNKQETTEKIEQNIDKTIENEKINTVEKEINEKIETLDKEINTTIENINKEVNQTIEKVNQTITNITQNTHIKKLPVTGM